MKFSQQRNRLINGYFKSQKAPSPSVPVQQSPIRWSQSGQVFRNSTCPICGALADELVLHMVSGEISLALLRCICGSVFYPDAQAPDYEVVEGREAFLMRVDQAEGVDSIIRSLLISPDIEDFALIDLGCGIGFAVDYSLAQGRPAQGFDPSPSSAISAQTLGVNIRGLPSTQEIQNFSHPNVVFASEVIEHVTDPRDFVRQLRTMTGDDGYAVLTTPSAEYVQEGNAEPTLVSILAPSQHLFLFSAKALEGLMKSEGYPWVHAWVVDERLFCVAGPRPIALQSTFSEAKYVDYLRIRLYDSNWIDESMRWRCYGYRLYKHLIHKGSYVEADVVWEGLVTTYSRLGLSLDKPVALTKQYVDGARALNGQISAEKFPFNAVMLLFLRGTYLIAHQHDKVAARPFLEAANELSQLYKTFFSDLPFAMYDREIASVPTWVADTLRLHWN